MASIKNIFIALLDQLNLKTDAQRQERDAARDALNQPDLVIPEDENSLKGIVTILDTFYRSKTGIPLWADNGNREVTKNSLFRMYDSLKPKDRLKINPASRRRE